MNVTPQTRETAAKSTSSTVPPALPEAPAATVPPFSDADGSIGESQERPSDHATPGPILFARFAYPPNSLGYCGPNDSKAVLQYTAAGYVDGGLAQLARGFSGAWPYLELIAGASGIADPLDRRVVEAYWLGNPLLERIDMALFGNSLLERFRRRAGSSWGHLAEAIPVGAVPHHSFHVFGIYPWVGLLGGDRVETPLHVLDRCRVRWGQIVSVDGDRAVVLSRPLTWDGRQVGLGEVRPEDATCALDRTALSEDFRPGDWVALHWDWVCDRLSRRQLTNLRRWTLHQLDITNRRVAHPGPAAALE
jgi:hypothetical protein